MEFAESALKNLYLIQRLSTWRIEKLTGWSRSTVYRKLGELGIKPRDLAESHIRYKRKRFDGDLLDKAYLTGFAIGDLRVRKIGKERCQTIGVACASTKPAQIELTRNLFAPYGRVWISKPNKSGKMFIEAFVDLSFNFLLPDERRAVDWIFNDDKCFLSFLAGFTDAEGSIFISCNKAFLSWGNYDCALLSRIKNALERTGVRTGRVICDNLRGYRGKEGYVRRADYYHLTCARKESLRNVLGALRPLLRHGDKRAALGRALENIATRDRK